MVASIIVLFRAEHKGQRPNPPHNLERKGCPLNRMSKFNRVGSWYHRNRGLLGSVFSNSLKANWPPSLLPRPLDVNLRVYRVAYRYRWSKNQSQPPQYREVRLTTIFITRTAIRTSKAAQSPGSAIATKSAVPRTSGRMPFSSWDISRSEGARTNASVGRYLRPQGWGIWNQRI